MNITISTNKIDALKKILKKSTIKAEVERLVNDWIDREILTYKKNRLNVDDIIDELSKEWTAKKRYSCTSKRT